MADLSKTFGAALQLKIRRDEIGARSVGYWRTCVIGSAIVKPRLGTPAMEGWLEGQDEPPGFGCGQGSVRWVRGCFCSLGPWCNRRTGVVLPL
jgi:hypothetical protein